MEYTSSEVEARDTLIKKNMNYTQQDAIRFWNNVNVPQNYENECWICHYSTNQNGYTHFSLNGKLISGHKFSYLYYHGYFADYSKGECILHKCDNPPCVSPYHLFLGTNKDNVIDKCEKERQAKGTQIYSAELTDSDIIDILEGIKLGRFKDLQDISNKYNITKNIPEKILKGHIWNHITKNYDLESIRKLIVKENRALRANTKLCIDDVRDIKCRLKNNQTVKQIALLYNVGIGTIYHIKSGRQWRFVK